MELRAAVTVRYIRVICTVSSVAVLWLVVALSGEYAGGRVGGADAASNGERGRAGSDGTVAEGGEATARGLGGGRIGCSGSGSLVAVRGWRWEDVGERVTVRVAAAAKARQWQ